ncbi:hypothetical protein E2C01_072437 [Portunus trituberculatus]|uniref:Uncharacterized protein n=1 Tax=Portunus trituberculatus TaxID=210409 RepID=A0A5B7I8Y5_PORTR|nr:hypothetical protein [Portunus trituberculatus]
MRLSTERVNIYYFLILSFISYISICIFIISSSTILFCNLISF